MRQTLSRGMVAAAAATGILSLCGGAALADSTAEGAAKGSPGAASGNNIQAPVDVPVNACGNTVDVVAALNPAFGNSCANDSDGHGGHGDGGRHHSSGGSAFDDGDDWPGDDGDDAEDWPGDEGDLPPGDGEDRSHGGGDTPRGDGGYGHDDGGGHGRDDDGYGRDDDGGYGYGDTPPTEPPHTPPTKPPHTPPTQPPHTPPPGGHRSTPPQTPPGTPPGGHHTPPGGQEQPPSLPETGAEALLGAAAGSAALITGGVVLYRRGRAASHR
ncbi:chaplin [Streptomyces sp. NPDC085932]|uniref:chaplin n=1 Tax=Streptomyces sp. NPDC085932 TaxID=3365741 RepID=UPI0037D6F385